LYYYVILGTHILSDTKILSTSLDQRLNLWEIDFDKQDEIDNVGFKLIKSEFVDVCDPSSMDILNINGNDVYIAIAGIGVEIFKI